MKKVEFIKTEKFCYVNAYVNRIRQETNCEKLLAKESPVIQNIQRTIKTNNKKTTGVKNRAE